MTEDFKQRWEEDFYRMMLDFDRSRLPNEFILFFKEWTWLLKRLFNEVVDKND